MNIKKKATSDLIHIQLHLGSRLLYILPLSLTTYILRRRLLQLSNTISELSPLYLTELFHMLRYPAEVKDHLVLYLSIQAIKSAQS